jgi:hypothetical protein
MKKILVAASVALCFASSPFAQEVEGGSSANESTIGGVATPTIVASAVGLGILGAVVANNRGNSVAEIVIENPPIECGAGEELVDGECSPIDPDTTGTNTVTATNTVTGTNPVTVTVTSTTL